MGILLDVVMDYVIGGCHERMNGRHEHGPLSTPFFYCLHFFYNYSPLSATSIAAPLAATTYPLITLLSVSN